MAAAKDDIDDSTAPLVEHLAELRTRLIRSVVAFLIAMVICFAFAGTILDFLLIPIKDAMIDLGNPNPVMQYTSPQEYFFTLVRISMVFGLAVSFPVIAHQLWRFVAPGLYKSEKNAFLPFIIASPVLFLIGASFAHFIVTPMAMAFFLGFADISSLFQKFLIDASTVPTTLDPAAATVAVPAVPAPEGPADNIDIVFFGKVNESLDITLKFIVAFGLCFQLPVLLTLMGKAELVSSVGLANTRKYAVVGILFLAAVATPPDVISQVILFAAVYALYEVSIQLVAWVERAREKKLREEGYYDDEDEAAADLAEHDGN